MTWLQVIRPGPLALLQDLGRPGRAHLGVSGSGAADRAAHRRANRLVANPADAATVEVTFGGFAVRVRGGAVTVAVSGADAQPSADGTPFGLDSVQRVDDGGLIEIGTPRTGVRTYLAVRGGIDAEPVLGSRSRDTLAELGPAPLRAGDALPVGAPGPAIPRVDQAPVATTDDEPAMLRIFAGPRRDWLADPAALTGTTWTVTESSDRVGVRLAGVALVLRDPDRTLTSEGTVRGAVQVPPGGLPVIFGPDHPVTGGYPVAAVITDTDLDRTAQLRPGQRLRLRWAHR